MASGRRAALAAAAFACCACRVLAFAPCTPAIALKGQAARPLKMAVEGRQARTPQLSSLAGDFLWGKAGGEAAAGGPSLAAEPSFGSFDTEVRRDLTGGRRPDGRKPEFEVNLGKVIETLRSDYPTIFDEPLDFSIYDKDIDIRDPTGVAFRGLNTYRRLFAVLRFFRHIFMSSAQTRFRITYDWVNEQVRVKWHTVIIMKSAPRRPLFIDGVSVYSLTDDGMVKSHHFETIVVNGTPVEPPYAYAWINLDAWVGAEVPTMVPGGVASLGARAASFAAAGAAAVAAAPAAMAAAITAPEAAAAPLAAAADSEGRSAAPRNQKNSKKGQDWLPKAPNQCESNWDCDSPMNCCDFVLFKICCNSGMGTPVWRPEMIPIPIPIDDDPYYGGGRGY